MNDTFKKFITHIILIIFEKTFTYLHQYFDIVYNIECDEIDFIDKEEQT